MEHTPLLWAEPFYTVWFNKINTQFSELYTADGQNVKLTWDQTITGDKTFTWVMWVAEATIIWSYWANFKLINNDVLQSFRFQNNPWTTILEIKHWWDIIVNWQNWTSAWTSYTPAVTGSGGGSGTIVAMNTSYKEYWKTFIYEWHFVISSKWTLSWRIQIQSPFTLRNNWREFIVCQSNYVWPVWWALNAQSRFIGTQPSDNANNLLVSSSFAWPYVNWADVSDWTWFTWRTILEIA